MSQILCPQLAGCLAGSVFGSLRYAAKAGVEVVLHDEHFTDDTTPDEVWLKEIGDRRLLAAEARSREAIQGTGELKGARESADRALVIWFGSSSMEI